jgi:hypothetical protein
MVRANEPEAKPSAGTRLGRLMGVEPELTRPAVNDADREMIRRFVEHIMPAGFDMQTAVTRMERLKFETIVTDKTYTEVLADPPADPPLDPAIGRSL